MAGVTEQGFTIKTAAEITADINAKFIGAFGSQFDTSAESPDGQTIGIMAEIIAEIWQQAEAAYNAFSPTSAYGIGLDKLVEINGITRIKDLPTSVALTLSGTAGVVVPAGYIVKTADGLEFATVAEAMLPAIVTANCTTQGAIYIGPDEVNVLTTAIAGFASANNEEPGITGIPREEDPALRARRELSTISRGTSSIDAIYQGVRALNLPYISIIENNTASEVDGIPAYSFLTVVEGGTPEEVSRVIYDNKPTNIRAFGNIVTDILDSKGYPHSIGISRPVPVSIYVIVNITANDLTSLDAADLIKDNVVKYINSINISDDVYWSYLFQPVLEATPNIRISSLTTSTLPGSGFGTVDIPISNQQRAFTEAAMVVVNVVYE